MMLADRFGTRISIGYTVLDPEAKGVETTIISVWRPTSGWAMRAFTKKLNKESGSV